MSAWQNPMHSRNTCAKFKHPGSESTDFPCVPWFAFSCPLAHVSRLTFYSVGYYLRISLHISGGDALHTRLVRFSIPPLTRSRVFRFSPDLRDTLSKKPGIAPH